MMRKILSITLIFTFISVSNADEGMWLLPLLEKLNIGTMQEMGLNLSAEDIYSINNSSIKDAIVIFDRGCTGEMVSKEGLLLTNHHCGYDKIQMLSSLENNYLEDGFWASNKAEELPAQGLNATFLKSIKDVTNQIIGDIEDDIIESERSKIINDIIEKILSEIDKNDFSRAEIKPYFDNNQYFLLEYVIYKDVRLVGTPPSSIGKYGYDTDNWVWPRHTGDFAVFRVYADKENNPAEYSNENIPYTPKHHLPVSIKGYEKGDFAMTLGYPGSTFRYLTSWGIEERINENNNTLIKVRGVKQDIWSEAMNNDPKTRLQYASKYSRSSNYWKNSIGMNRGLERLHVIEQKRAIEDEFSKWANIDGNDKYKDVLKDLEVGYNNRKAPFRAQIYLRETLLMGTEIYLFARNAESLEDALKSNDKEKISKAIEELKNDADDFYKDYNPKLDKLVLAEMISLYISDVETKYHPTFLNSIKTKYKNNSQKYAERLFAKSIFTNRDRLNKFLDNPNLKVLQKDLAYIGTVSTFDKYREIYNEVSTSNNQLDRGKRLFLAGLMKMNPEKTYYSDANFTMRLSYGSVGDYEPSDAVIYKHYTTLEGVMEKEDPNDRDFYVDAKLKELYEAKDYGKYADKDGRLYVNFISNNDITGGNSGSPVINGDGELIGLAFDGNWEAMSGDIAFENELQKCINVDIRYVLFVIDKFAGATHLINEMTIVE